jgi:pyruvate dehydrogenase E1 component alpha subunit
VEKIRESRDCIRHFAGKVTSAGLLKQSELENIDREVAALVEDSVNKAKSAPKPLQADLLTDVYISY